MLLEEYQHWIKEFRAKHGRPPRVLHIGNIANNAYLNAKFLRSVGVESDVLCYDYYHIMGCPEWEDAKIEGDFGSSGRPEWFRVQLGKFKRPSWFVQGPQDLCLRYLIARNEGRNQEAELLWHELSMANGTLPKGALRKEAFADRLRHKLGSIRVVRIIHLFMFERRAMQKVVEHLSSSRWTASGKRELFARSIAVILIASSIPCRLAGGIYSRIAALKSKIKSNNSPDVQSCYAPTSPPVLDSAHFISVFRKMFPNRQSVLQKTDMDGYLSVYPQFAEVFRHYDLIQGYATDGVYPMFAGSKYVAFEHGTIRNIPFEDTPQGRLCALTYRLADTAVITNADNYVAAQKLGLKQYRFIPHPINDHVLDELDGQIEYSRLHAELDSDFIIFHPARQHWDSCRHPDWEKGNDFFLRGFAKFVHTVNPKAAAILVNWGAAVDDSKKLIVELGIENRVRWIEPLPHRQMMQMIIASDAVADQFFLGAFGSTMPKALACGKPALLYLNVKMHQWCFSEMPPVVNVQSEQQIFEGLSRMYQDRSYYLELCAAGKAWYEKWHSSTVIVNSLVAIYKNCVLSK